MLYLQSQIVELVLESRCHWVALKTQILCKLNPDSPAEVLNLSYKVASALREESESREGLIVCDDLRILVSMVPFCQFNPTNLPYLPVFI